MICKNCGEKMDFQGRDFYSLGMYDDCFACPKCVTLCVLEVMFSKPFRERWHSENGGVVKDEIIKR